MKVLDYGMKDLNYKNNKKNIRCGNNKQSKLYKNNYSNQKKIFNTLKINQKQQKEIKKNLIF